LGEPAVTRWAEEKPPTREALVDALRREGLNPGWWSNGPGDRYAPHSHGYHKVVYCASGSITFRSASGAEFELAPGDRLDVPRGATHAAVVGDRGVTCLEGRRGEP